MACSAYTCLDVCKKSFTYLQQFSRYLGKCRVAPFFLDHPVDPVSRTRTRTLSPDCILRITIPEKCLPVLVSDKQLPFLFSLLATDRINLHTKHKPENVPVYGFSMPINNYKFIRSVVGSKKRGGNCMMHFGNADKPNKKPRVFTTNRIILYCILSCRIVYYIVYYVRLYTPCTVLHISGLYSLHCIF